MKGSTSETQNTTGMQPCLSPMAVWAMSVGSAIGWGALVVTGRTYLSQAGPLGSILGLLIGLVLMLMFAWNYHFLANRYPGTGGLYNYVKFVFGYDRAFLAAWFLFLVYISIFWANAASIPLFARYFLHGAFRVGYLYTVFGYEVYLGEALVTLAVIVFVALLCIKSKRTAARSMEVLVWLFCIGITICFVAATAGRGREGIAMGPAFIPNSAALRQVVHIAFISPWAFIGFESVSHSVAEYRFEHSRLYRILVASLIVITAMYIFVILLSISAYPEGCSSWLDYIGRLDEFEGIAGLPAFYAAGHYLGPTGIYILMACMLALVLTSMIGLLRAVSRLCYAAAQDGILSERYARLSEHRIPVNTMILVLLVSLPIPFLGGTTIGWIVDTTAIGAVILYGFASAAVFKVSGQEGRKKDCIISGVCLVALAALTLFLMFPGVFSDHSIETETYALMMVWSILGLVFFNGVIRKDHARSFGKAIIVWIALLAFIVTMALTWTERINEDRENAVVDEIHSYINGTGDSAMLAMDEGAFLDAQRERLHAADNTSFLVIMLLFGISLAVMLINYLSMHKWEKKATEERDQARTVTFTDPLTGVKSKHAFLMSEKQHDAAIREKTEGEFAIVVCDLNDLKKTNDTLGHKAGDEYIISASRMICDIFQHSPVYRTGGDEFAAILTGRDYLIRKELVLALHDRSVEHMSSEGVVISGGLSEYRPGEDTCFNDVFERADALMYEEKSLLKGMGAVARDETEPAVKPPFPVGEGESPDILQLKRQVLIVEDEQINQMILGNMLSDGYELLYASDGIEALTQIKTYKDDLAIVLLDLQMPHMTGMEVLKVMKEEAELRDIPVIVMTADQSAEVECLKIGAIDFIPKPYPTWEIVQARVNRCIELSEKRNIIQSTERDSLTNLFNLDYFLRYVRMYDQHYTDVSMDAIVLDVNHFHLLNERYGKQYGDSVLARIGKRVRQISREIGGVGCRRGADTFLIYCPHREDYGTILDKASDGLVDDDTSENRVRLRMGVYSQVDKSLEIERRFDYAKTAANTVKSGYLKAIGIYDIQMHEAELNRERLLEDFKPSLEGHRFMVYFQPKFDVRPEEPILASAEALVRWDHPELGMISPGVFIPLLEENGLILALDQFVWRETAARIREWKDRFGYSVPVSVNVSRIDMLTPNLKGIFREILDAYALNEADLMLEITESAYTGDADQVVAMAKELRSMGFRIEMDDFGTGYSSLGMLSHLPIDALKLDMSFVRSAFGKNKDVRMIELIIDIADYLHVPVVAEGVETKEQCLVLKAMGCDLVQGYYFSKPVPHDSFARFIVERAQTGTEVTLTTRKTGLSISRALSSDFESIFYVDVATDGYIEFYRGDGGELEIRPDGADFFGEARDRLLEGVCGSDAEKAREATAKENVMRWVGQEENASIQLRKLKDGQMVAYSLEVIKTRESDDRHIVIGVRPGPANRNA